MGLALPLALRGLAPSLRLRAHLLASAHELHEGAEELLKIIFVILLVIVFRRGIRILLDIFIFFMFIFMIVLSILFITILLILLVVLVVVILILIDGIDVVGAELPGTP